MAKGIEQDIISQGNLFISPIEFFCGDEVTLSFDFIVSEGTALDLEATPHLEYINQEDIEKIITLNPDEFFIKSILLDADKNNVNVKMNCVFWKPEKIKLPSIKIKLKNENLVINIPEFNVSSILEKTHSTSIRPYKEPVIIPNTTLIVWGEVLLGLGVAAGIITACIKIKTIKAFFKKLKTNRIYRRNFRRAVQKAKLLSKFSPAYNDEVYCQHIQAILRDYLAVRFTDKIYNLTTSEIITWFNDVFGKLLPEYAEESVSLFYEVMFRCDFLRFSGDSIPDAKMQQDERKTLLEKTIRIIEVFEKGIVE